MTIISPSLLACDFLNIEPELNAFAGVKDMWFHLDIMDGHFVPNLTFGHPIIELITKKAPHKCDAHFMVTNPEFHGEILKDSGLYNFTFHVEATPDSLGLIKKLKSHYPSVGISIKPNTPVSALTDEILKAIDLVLVMSVEPGFGGQSFMPSAFDKIKELKSRRESLKAHFQIQVDGGVTDKNSKELIAAGADNLVAGSYVFKTTKDKYAEKIESLR
ncbi:ribulose-phosphate 3-epimerase [Bacteriovorax sp. PP10]|uniref:Ribulose-phosphate 3-epimerase n=1 Tax=Bacteriovorax antarcticus TaxID=3088717 RepID=A0ABU5VQD9_9BACT|nr:ribulose-phosphate 3-epimerase [Bacteriovorax sp. PP10]MEA9354827.1 ribulose-phosphate 3-epimerase [Bacteriovorax sp. PP10]